MGKIEEALQTLGTMDDITVRARELAGLVSTLFKLRGVALAVTGELAFTIYADTSLEYPGLELAAVAGKPTPRLLQEIMAGQLYGEGSILNWQVLDIPIRFHTEPGTAARESYRDLRTDYGVVKLAPAEEIAAERILAATYPVRNPRAYEEAVILLTNGLRNAFQMNWAELNRLCHEPEYRVGEELAQLRMLAKQEADALEYGLQGGAGLANVSS